MKYNNKTPVAVHTYIMKWDKRCKTNSKYILWYQVVAYRYITIRRKHIIRDPD